MKLVIIGSSTGGPGHLLKILKQLPIGYKPCVVIAQHIGEQFLASLIQNLISECHLPISACKNRQKLSSGAVFFAKGEHINEIASDNNGLSFNILDEISDTYAPNINRLFSSAAKNAKKFDSILAVLLTGIGDDGAAGMMELKKHGAYTIAESKDSAIVYGMPRCAIETGAAMEELSIDQISKKIASFGL